MRRGWVLLLLVGCGAPKEAADPSTLDDTSVGGAEDYGSPGPTGDARSTRDTGDAPLATPAQCDAVARRMLELAYDAAGSELSDDAARARHTADRAAWLSSEATRRDQAHLRDAECVSKRTTAKEATCIVAARDAAAAAACDTGK